MKSTAPSPPISSFRPTMAITTLLLTLQLILTILQLDAKEIVGTNEWQLLGENDTVPAGLHIKLDLSTGERWARLVQDEDETDTQAHAGVAVDTEMDKSGALTITHDPSHAGNSHNDDARTTAESETPFEPQRDYEMMHRVMSRIPPEELDRFGGLPALPLPHHANASDKDAVLSISPEERAAFQARMEELWTLRQEELRKFQEENMADIPMLLKERIEVLRRYVGDPAGERKRVVEKRRQLLQDENESKGEEELEAETSIADDIIECLKDLEYQLSDVDVARDFHTLGGWPYLVSLLQDSVHSNCNVREEERSLVYEIQSLAAMTIGTAVSNLEEFRPWALEDVSSAMRKIWMDPKRVESRASENDCLEDDFDTNLNGQVSALHLLTQSFEMELHRRSSATSQTDSLRTQNHVKDSFRTSKLRAVYALGSLLRGNASAQHQFVSRHGPDALVRYALGILSSVNGEDVTKSDYKLASRVLALGEDVVMDVILHEQDYDGHTWETMTPNQMVAAFTTEPWCDLSLRMLSPPLQIVGKSQARSMKERALSAVRALGPGCKETLQSTCSNPSEECNKDGTLWGVPQVLRVKAEWNREGSGDGLDSVYRRELLDLVDGVLETLQR